MTIAGNGFSRDQRNDIRDRFLVVECSNVADVLDGLGFPDQGLSPEFLSIAPEGARLAGWAYTIRGQTGEYPPGGDPEKMSACSGVSQGDVTVWSGDGAGICYFGELIAIGMKERGSCGALVDGGVRDLRWIKAIEYPVFARYRSPVQSIGRWKVNGYQIPVKISGATTRWVTVRPGDFILADSDGVIAIPAGIVEATLVASEALMDKEAQIRADIGKGLSLNEALSKYGHV